jgi:tripartite-type tricarboxylate transporter receptor subunit TctC
MKCRTFLHAAAGADLVPVAIFLQEKYPNKPITLNCQYGAGGSADNRSRHICKLMSWVLGQPSIVDSKAGVRGNIGTEARAQASWLHHRDGQLSVARDEPRAVQETQLRPD